MTRHAGKKTQAGFTLFEVLAAMSLFAIASLGMAQFAAQNIRHTADNRASTGAVILAQQEIEDQRSLDYIDIASRTFTASIGNQGYTVTTAVANDTPAAGMKQLTVTVNWSSPIGSRSYAVQTILTAVN
ncbi:MAG TPA: prepilin-type N-terminal cleavage/methylation domain-containing protein [Candidatus Eisenbacteria bacterium]|nr:prepilin-type N-terminal cleavage/methylation domain-containing protein [Candidatus Eisenbacteria bacterium]